MLTLTPDTAVPQPVRALLAWRTRAAAPPPH